MDTLSNKLESTLVNLVYPATPPNDNTVELDLEELGFVAIERRGDLVYFTVDQECEPKLHRMFGFASDQIDGRMSVAGFMAHSEQDGRVKLMIKRPFLMNQMI